jgi:hypothetical protein
MGSTVPSVVRPIRDNRDAPALSWRSWPLRDRPRWWWLPIVGILSIAALVAYVGESLLLALVMAMALAASLWQLFVPIDYEMGPLGLRWSALGRWRVLPWHAIQAYQPRSTGVVLYRRDDPTNIDLLRSLFLPYPNDVDEMLAVLRQHLSHAIELSE